MEFETVWKHLELLRLLVEYIASKKDESRFEDIMKIYKDSNLNTDAARAVLSDIIDYGIHNDYRVLFGDLNDEIGILCQDYYDFRACDDCE